MNKESRLLNDEIRGIARSMITCSHANLLNDEGFDNYLSAILAKSVKAVIDEIKGILHDWDKWTDEEGGEEKWQAKYGHDTTDLIRVIEEHLEALKRGIDEK